MSPLAAPRGLNPLFELAVAMKSYKFFAALVFVPNRDILSLSSPPYFATR